MSQYRLDIVGTLGLGDYSDINNYIDLVDFNDSFTIAFDSVSAENIEIVCRILEEKGLIVTSKDTSINGKMNLHVIKV